MEDIQVLTQELINSTRSIKSHHLDIIDQIICVDDIAEKAAKYKSMLENKIIGIIIAHYCKESDVQINDLLNDSRKVKVVDTRMMIAYTLRIKCHCTLIKVGEILKRHHTSIINLTRQHCKYMEYDPAYRDKYNQITAKFNFDESK